jgi:hypothetical protein
MFCGWPKSSLPGGLAKAHKPERQEPPGSTLKADLAAKISHVYEATGSNWPLSPSWQGCGSPPASTCAASPRASHWSRPSRSDVTRRAPSPITHSSRSSVTRGIPGAPLARSERTTASMAFRSESGTRSWRWAPHRRSPDSPPPSPGSLPWPPSCWASCPSAACC